MSKTRIVRVVAIAMSVVFFSGCASGPERISLMRPCGAGTIFYGSNHDNRTSYTFVSHTSEMTAADLDYIRIDYRFGNGESYPNRKIRSNGERFQHQLGTGNDVEVRCPGGVVHRFSNQDRTEGLASNREWFNAVGALGQAANQMQAEADARRAYQNSLYANIPPLPASKSTAASATSDSASDNPSANAAYSGPTSIAKAKPQNAAAGSASAVSTSSSPSKQTAGGTTSTGTRQASTGATSGTASAAATSKSATTSGTAKGKPVAAGVLIVDDSAAKARVKFEQEMAASQKKADADYAAQKAKYAAEAARVHAAQQARADELARQRKARGNRQ